MSFFRKKREITRDTETTTEVVEPLLRALIAETDITTAKAMEIPAVAGCVAYIAGTIAALPIKLYKATDKVAEEITDDVRVRLVNDDTGDTLDALQLKYAVIKDYLLTGRGLAYVCKSGNIVQSMHYVQSANVSALANADPIFKTAKYNIMGVNYPTYSFVQLLRGTEDGVTGKGIVQDNAKQLAIAYNMEILEHTQAKSGGVKRGFLQAAKHVDDKVLTALKTDWNAVYKGDSADSLALNDGVTFKEISNSSVEMQLQENKELNNRLICQLFCLAPELLTGSCTGEQLKNSVQTALLPVIKALESALNRALLLEIEKPTMYFKIDTAELLKSDTLSRYQAYQIGLDKGFLTVDEVRYAEDYEPLGFDYIKLGLDTVLLDLKSNKIYTPNTNQTTQLEIKDIEGSETNEGTDKG